MKIFCFVFFFKILIKELIFLEIYLKKKEDLTFWDYFSEMASNSYIRKKLKFSYNSQYGFKPKQPNLIQKNKVTKFYILSKRPQQHYTREIENQENPALSQIE